MITRRIKCRFCNFAVSPFYRTKGGRTRDWFSRMARHIEYAHPTEFNAEQNRCDDDDTGNRSLDKMI